MSDGVLTRALADLERAGIPLAATLDPAMRDDCLRAPGIGLKAFDRLQEAAVKAAELKRGRGGAGRGQGRKPISQVDQPSRGYCDCINSPCHEPARESGTTWRILMGPPSD